MSAIFVTATGTDVGKTFVCCRLIEALDGQRALRVIKPVATGVDPEALDQTDTALLLGAQGRPIDSVAFERATPWHYREPMSPDMAAAREKRTIPFDEVIAFSGSNGSDADLLTIIEGIGGAMVPLDSRHTVLDWMAALNPVVWLVAGTYLGSISHTLTALRALEGAELRVGAIVLSESAESPTTPAEIAAAIGRFAGDVPVVGLGRPPTPAQLERLTALLPGDPPAA